MSMRRHVYWHAVVERGKIGSMVKIKAAQEILVRFAAARMLCGDEARDYLKQLGDALDRPVIQVDLTD